MTTEERAELDRLVRIQRMEDQQAKVDALFTAYFKAVGRVAKAEAALQRAEAAQNKLLVRYTAASDKLYDIEHEGDN